jgi:hypothetical protein
MRISKDDVVGFEVPVVKWELVSNAHDLHYSASSANGVIYAWRRLLNQFRHGWSFDELHHKIEFNVLLLPLIFIRLQDARNPISAHSAKAADLHQKPIAPFGLLRRFSMEPLKRANPTICFVPNLLNVSLASGSPFLVNADPIV